MCTLFPALKYVVKEKVFSIPILFQFDLNSYSIPWLPESQESKIHFSKLCVYYLDNMNTLVIHKLTL